MMVLLVKQKIGRSIEDIKVGEKINANGTNFEDKDILLYLGLTNDSELLYIYHDYASL